MTAPTGSPADRPLPFAPDLLRGQTAIVTGAAGGIGREIAHLAARLGARVVLAGRTPAKLDALAGELAAFPALVHAVDVRERDAVDALYAAHPCDLVIHAAGGQFPQPAIDFTTKGFRAVIATNLEVSGGGHLWGETWTTAKPAWFRAASRALDPDPGLDLPPDPGPETAP